MAKTKSKGSEIKSKGYGPSKLEYSKPTITSRYPTKATDPLYLQPISQPLPSPTDSRMLELSDLLSNSMTLKDIGMQIAYATEELKKKLKKKKSPFDYL